jgi:molecular chaperone GrpE
LTHSPSDETNPDEDQTLSHPFLENEPDDESFSISLDDSILNEALASVEKSMGRRRRKSAMDLGPLDLDALTAMEDELAIEIEEDETPSATLASTQASVEARLRAMDAETEAQVLKEKLGDLAANRDQIESQMRNLKSRAKKSLDAQRVAEQRNTNLKTAYDQQQNDLERLQERRSKERGADHRKGQSDTILAIADVIDNLFRALEHKEGSGELVTKGIEICLGQLEGSLLSTGIETIIPKEGDAFDPTIHEALTSEVSDTIETGHIVSVVSRGYRIAGTLIRPARVCVAK